MSRGFTPRYAQTFRETRCCELSEGNDSVFCQTHSPVLLPWQLSPHSAGLSVAASVPWPPVSAAPAAVAADPAAVSGDGC